MDKPARVGVLGTELTKDALRRLMPLDTMVTDLWDWDIHFEDATFADNYFDVALGPEEFVAAYAEDLKEDFLRWIREYDMDCAQDLWDSQEEFEQYLLDQCQLFIRKWRCNIAGQFLTDQTKC